MHLESRSQGSARENQGIEHVLTSTTLVSSGHWTCQTEPVSFSRIILGSPLSQLLQRESDGITANDSVERNESDWFHHIRMHSKVTQSTCCVPLFIAEIPGLETFGSSLLAFILRGRRLGTYQATKRRPGRLAKVHEQDSSSDGCD